MKCTKKQFEDIVAFSTPQVRQWLQEGMPHRIIKGHGKAGMNYEIETREAIPWLLRRYKTTRKTIPAAEMLRMEQRKKVAFDNAVRSGELLEYGKVAQEFAEVMSNLSNELEGLPGRLANELAGFTDPGAVRRRLLEECRTIRRNVAEGLRQRAESISPSEDGGAVDGPSTDTDGKRVGGRKANPSPRKRRARKVAK